MQPVRPRAKRTLHRLKVSFSNILDLSSELTLKRLGISKAEIASLDFTACQQVGGAAAHLGHDGILVPSARHGGLNLVVFVANSTADSAIQATESELIDPGR